MQAFLNDKNVKTKYVARVRAHQKADEIVKGQYWNDGRGCAVGCTTHGDDHKAYETELGIPEEIAFLEDGIFENLPIEEANGWPLKFLQAIPIGADLSRVHYQFLAWLLTEETGILSINDSNRQAIATVRALHERGGAGDTPTEDEWSAAESAAESAARSAAESAAWSAAWSAAESAAESAAWSAAWSAAESAAWSAAWSAAESAARSAARSAAYQKMAAKLLELMAAA